VIATTSHNNLGTIAHYITSQWVAIFISNNCKWDTSETAAAATENNMRNYFI